MDREGEGGVVMGENMRDPGKRTEEGGKENIQFVVIVVAVAAAAAAAVVESIDGFYYSL